MTTTQVDRPPGVLLTLFMMLIIAGAVVVYLVLGGLMGLGPLYAGFLFILYWAGIDQSNPKQYVPDLAGAAAGATNAWLLHVLPEQFGPAGVYLGLAVIGIAVFCQIRRWLPQVFNMGYMLFLTVLAIPGLMGQAGIVEIVSAILFGAIYIRVAFFLVGSVQSLVARRRAAQEVRPATGDTAL